MLSLAFRLLTVVRVTTALVACSGVPQATVQEECYDCDWPGWPVTDGTKKPVTDTTEVDLTDLETDSHTIEPLRVFVELWQFGHQVTTVSAASPATMAAMVEQPNEGSTFVCQMPGEGAEAFFVIYKNGTEVGRSSSGVYLWIQTWSEFDFGVRRLITWSSGFTETTMASWGPFPAPFTVVAMPVFGQCGFIEIAVEPLSISIVQ